VVCFLTFNIFFVILLTYHAANQGIGFELVRQLAQKGHTVYLGSRSEEKGKEAVYVHFF
jgi:short-subunit dehydrogenase